MEGRIEMAEPKQLTPSQQELLDAMKAGVVLHYMPYVGRVNPNEYYFRSDTMRKCTSPAKALLKAGLVQVTNKDWRGHTLEFEH
jgi:hypothetical protein